ncbi:MAG: hypothetical protein HQ546_10625 [Planctomycetes bacterium]|nr:hypothetical protein [Planctomycetota bacterium]
MKRLMMILAVAALMMAGAVPAEAASTWTVNPGDSIQTAVNSAADGDTISIVAGTYTEQVGVTAGKGLTFAGAGRDVVTWIAPAGGKCIVGDMSGYTGNMSYEISGVTFNSRSEAASGGGTGIMITGASSGPLSLDIHDNQFIEDRASGDTDHWSTSMWLCHNRYAARDGLGDGAVRIYDNIDTTWGGMTMSNSQAYDIFNNLFDGASDAIYNGHGCPDAAGQTFGDHHIYGNTFANASDDLHGPDSGTPAIVWSYYGAGEGTHLPSTIDENCFWRNDTAIEFGMGSDMVYPAHVITNNNFCENGMAVSVGGDYASTLNAQGNWWGAADGPGPVGPGSGDPITLNVDYGSFAAAAIEGVPVTAPIPEPAGLGLIGLALLAVRKKRN